MTELISMPVILSFPAGKRKDPGQISAKLKINF